MALNSILLFEIEHTIENNLTLTYRKKSMKKKLPKGRDEIECPG
jgi:hypothetical protein